MKKRAFLSTFTGIITCITVPISTRSAENDAPSSQTEYIKLEVKGFVTGIVAIGAETSGYAITAKNVTLELEFQGNKENINRAKRVAGSRTPVNVKGTLKKILGVVRKERLVFSVEEIMIDSNQ